MAGTRYDTTICTLTGWQSHKFTYTEGDREYTVGADQVSPRTTAEVNRAMVGEKFLFYRLVKNLK